MNITGLTPAQSRELVQNMIKGTRNEIDLLFIAQTVIAQLASLKEPSPGVIKTLQTMVGIDSQLQPMEFRELAIRLGRKWADTLKVSSAAKTAVLGPRINIDSESKALRAFKRMSGVTCVKACRQHENSTRTHTFMFEGHKLNAGFLEDGRIIVSSANKEQKK